jgi:hypothetical protein
MGEAYFRTVESEDYRGSPRLEAYAPGSADRPPFVFLNVEKVTAVQEYFAGRRDHDCRRSPLARACQFPEGSFERYRGW